MRTRNENVWFDFECDNCGAIQRGVVAKYVPSDGYDRGYWSEVLPDGWISEYRKDTCDGCVAAIRVALENRRK